MKKIRIAIIGASEIAYRRFMPALLKDDRFLYVGVAIERKEDIEKAHSFQHDYGGEIIDGYDKAIHREDIDALYVPQPPALHFIFGEKVLDAGKHLFMEKPFTTSWNDSNKLIEMAKNNNLAVIENYMFRFHNQVNEFYKLSHNKELIGDLKSYEVRFSFPQRSMSDFRYNKELGGGALFDCGGYTIMLSDILLNKKGEMISFKSCFYNEFDVDIEGFGEMKYGELVCNFSFGMNNPYCCYAKAFGTKGILVAPRVLTAPFDYEVEFELLDSSNNKQENIYIGKDDTFLKSIDNFYNCIIDYKIRKENYEMILRQSKLVEIAKEKGEMN